MSFKKLKLRIKKNEGFSNKPYKDQLGYFTIGYGHLIKKNENKYFRNNYENDYFKQLFEKDFSIAVRQYNNFFYKKKFNKVEKEVLIEMFYQLGPRGVLKFKKMLYYLEKKQKHMTCLEMMDSLWYKQTPNRVRGLIKRILKN